MNTKIALKPNLIQEIQQLGEKYQLRKIILFGSRARNTHRLTSDIDLAIETPAFFNQMGYFMNEIENLNTLLKIDIITISDEINSELLKNIIKDGIILYESKI